jgi:hypothetical protein
MRQTVGERLLQRSPPSCALTGSARNGFDGTGRLGYGCDAVLGCAVVGLSVDGGGVGSGVTRRLGIAALTAGGAAVGLAIAGGGGAGSVVGSIALMEPWPLALPPRYPLTEP